MGWEVGIEPTTIMPEVDITDLHSIPYSHIIKKQDYPNTSIVLPVCLDLPF